MTQHVALAKRHDFFVAAGNSITIPDCSPTNCTAWKLFTGASRSEECPTTSGPGITIADASFSSCGDGNRPGFPRSDALFDVTVTVRNPSLLQIQ